MCPWPGATNPQIFIPWYYSNTCDEYVDINSQYAVQADQIQVPLGPGRPASLDFTPDFVDYDIAWVGSYFDKSNIMWYLGRNRPQFYRFNYDLDRRTYQISLYRLFESDIRNFWDKLVNLDPYLISQETATGLGSWWCRDPNNMTVAHLGHFEPRQMLSTDTGQSITAPPSDCLGPVDNTGHNTQAAVVYPELLYNMPFEAIFYAFALFSSPLDTQLDMSKSIKIFVKGSYDDYPSWDQLPANMLCSSTDIQTGYEYRSIHQPAGIPDLGCRLIARADQAQVDYLNNESDDFQKERWRSWYERLEYVRRLGQIFDK
jgi:hypothetical protein